MLKFLGTTLAAAVFTPFTPLMLLYGLFHTIRPSGNGADMWVTVAILGLGAIGTLGCVFLVPFAVANPLFFGVAYGFWCLCMGLVFGR